LETYSGDTRYDNAVYKSFVNQLYASTFSMVTNVVCIAKNGHVSQNYKTDFYFVIPVVLPLSIYIAIYIIHLVVMAFMLAVY